MIDFVNLSEAQRYHYEWSPSKESLYISNETDEFLIIFPENWQYCYVIKVKE